MDARFAERACTSLGALLRPDFAGVLASGQIPVSMRVGEAAHRAGFEGLLVPSARDFRGYNLVVFPDRIRTGSLLEPVWEES